MSVQVPHSILPVKDKKRKTKHKTDDGFANDESIGITVVEEDVKEGKKRKKKKKEKNKGGDNMNVIGDKHESGTKHVKGKKLEEEKDEKVEEINPERMSRKEEKKRKRESKNKADEERNTKVRDEAYTDMEPPSSEKKKKKKKNKHASESSIEMPEKIVEEYDTELDNNRDSSGSVRKEEKKNKKKKKKTKKKEEEEKSNNTRSNNSKSVKDAKGKNVREGETRTNSREGSAGCSGKKVKFSGDIEIFPLSDADNKEGGLVRGKRFSTEEDQFLQDAILKYIKEHDLGDDGIQKVMHCRNYPEIRNCWKEISPVMPWRTQNSIYNRAHILYQRADKREWTPEEKEALRNFFKEHGPDWRKFADEFGKYRIHVKDTWRRINVPNKKEGPWSQEEYQNYFDLVNMDLRMKIFEEKKSKHGMLRDDIAWGAVSHKLSTRSDSECCMKWYKQLASPLVQQKLWSDLDDYRLLNELAARDYSSVEEVDWDNLLDHRPGDICQKRWYQMYNHLGEHGDKAFADQLEVLLNRYCPDVHEAREIYQNKTPVD